MKKTIPASSDAAFLAALPRVTGYTAENSLVVALFHGTIAMGAFRLDLPRRRRTADARAIAEFIVATVTRANGIDRVLPVVYTDETFAGQHGIPWDDFADDVAHRVHRTGVHFAGFFCVASDGWGDYFTGRPAYRHELSEITENPDFVPVQVLETRPGLPEVGDDERRALCQAVERLDPFLDTDPGDVLEAYLRDESDLQLRAELALLVQSPPVRDRLAMQIAFGPLVGGIVGERNHRLLDVQHGRGARMDDAVLAELDAGTLNLDDEIDRLWLGCGRIRPDVDRVNRGIALLAHLAACLQGVSRSAPLCMLGWLSWALGRGSAAGHYLNLARQIDPEYGMAGVLSELVVQVPFPEWALPQGPLLEI